MYLSIVEYTNDMVCDLATDCVVRIILLGGNADVGSVDTCHTWISEFIRLNSTW